MYAYLADLPVGFPFPTPVAVPEGILDWKAVDWVLDARNQGVVSNIRYFLPPMLRGEPPGEHRFTYDGDRVVHYEAVPLVGGHG